MMLYPFMAFIPPLRRDSYGSQHAAIVIIDPLTPLTLSGWMAPDRRTGNCSTLLHVPPKLVIFCENSRLDAPPLTGCSSQGVPSWFRSGGFHVKTTVQSFLRPTCSYMFSVLVLLFFVFHQTASPWQKNRKIKNALLRTFKCFSGVLYHFNRRNDFRGICVRLVAKYGWYTCTDRRPFILAALTAPWRFLYPYRYTQLQASPAGMACLILCRYRYTCHAVTLSQRGVPPPGGSCTPLAVHDSSAATGGRYSSTLLQVAGLQGLQISDKPLRQPAYRISDCFSPVPESSASAWHSPRARGKPGKPLV